MASSFDRWEKDPFFSAAEEVQESADRMETTYRTWIHAQRDTSDISNAKELRRDLLTTLGTTKWQLEELERAVNSSYRDILADDARDRHRDFIIAIDNQISKTENSLQESSISEGRGRLPWVHLDQGECNELALFLTGPAPDVHTKINLTVPSVDEKKTSRNDIDKESIPECSNESRDSTEWSSKDVINENAYGHRRSASANADIGAWKISVADGGYLRNSYGEHVLPPRKVPSFSGLLSTMESSAFKLKLSKNGFRKWKIFDRRADSDAILLKPPLPSKGIKACYEKRKSCVNGCEHCYEKRLYGWYGAVQRQLQRSQYHMQHSRPIQVTFWLLLFLCLLGLVAKQVM